MIKTPSVPAWLQAVAIPHEPQNAQETQKFSHSAVSFCASLWLTLLLRASEGSLEIDWLQTGGPVFDRSSIWL